MLAFDFVVSLARRVLLKSGLGPTAEILSLRKPSLVFALRASLSAVQIRSRRICAWSKESIQRKGHPMPRWSCAPKALNGPSGKSTQSLRGSARHKGIKHLARFKFVLGFCGTVADRGDQSNGSELHVVKQRRYSACVA